MITENTVFQNRGQYLGKVGDSHVVLLDETEYELAPAAIYVWMKSDGARTVGKLIDEASAELGMSRDELSGPITLIIEKLCEANLLVKKED